MRTLWRIGAATALSLGLGCDGASERKTPETKPATETKAAPTSAEPLKPETPREAAPLVLAPTGVAGLNAQTELELKALEAAFPGYTITQETETGAAEGDTHTTTEFFVQDAAGASQLALWEDDATIRVRLENKALKDAEGLGFGSTFKQLTDARPERKCKIIELTERADGVEPFKQLYCWVGGEKGTLSFEFDIAALTHEGDDLPSGPEVDALKADNVGLLLVK